MIFLFCVWCFINIKGIIHPRIKIDLCFIFIPSFYSLKSCFKPAFPSSAKHKHYFEEGGKPNSCWSTVTSIVFFFPTVKVNVDQQLFGYPHSSKYLLTDVNVCSAVQYIDTAAPELQLIECVLYDTTIFLQKQIVETFLSGPLLAKNGCPKQDFIVVPPPSNIMEVKKN